jgi:hypothetical protein
VARRSTAAPKPGQKDAETRPTDRLGRVRAINEYLEAGVKIGLILAGIFAGLQYYASVRAGRVERVLGYAREFDTGELLEAQRHVDRALADMSRRIDAGPGNREAAVAREEAAMMRALREDAGGLGGELRLILGFMDKLSACQRRDVCDADLVRDYFQPYAAAVAAAFQCHLLDERRRRAAYGDGLLAVARIGTLHDRAAGRCPLLD